MKGKKKINKKWLNSLIEIITFCSVEFYVSREVICSQYILSACLFVLIALLITIFFVFEMSKTEELGKGLETP